MKKSEEILSLYTCVLKIMIICYTVPGIWHMTRCNYFSFWAIFCPFTAKQPKKSKFKKPEKTPGDIVNL